MLKEQTKRDVSSVLNLTLEVLETWEGTKKEEKTDATMPELITCAKFCVEALSNGKTWEKVLTRSLEIDDDAIDFNEAIAIDDVRAIAEDSDDSRLETIQKFFIV